MHEVAISHIHTSIVTWTCVKWFVHICDMHTWMCVKWFVHICDIPNSDIVHICEIISHISSRLYLICVTHIYCHVTRGYAWHDVADMCESHVTCGYVWNDVVDMSEETCEMKSQVWTMLLYHIHIHVLSHDTWTCVKWFVHICDKLISYVWHILLTHMAWLIQMCHTHLWFICVSHIYCHVTCGYVWNNVVDMREEMCEMMSQIWTMLLYHMYTHLIISHMSTCHVDISCVSHTHLLSHDT